MAADGSHLIPNGGPPLEEPTPFDAYSAHVSDLMETARGFLDGTGVQSEGEATAVSKLLDDLRTVAKDADKARAAEKKPHDDAGKVVQAKWKPLLERCDTGADVCKRALAPYLQRQEAERRRQEAETRAEADRKRQEAEAAMRASQADDLASREDAERLAKDAKAAEAEANRATKAKGQATGGARATTLRTVYRAEVTDVREACRHYWTTNPAAFEPLIQQLADQDVRAGKRQIAGVTVHTDQVVV